VSDLKVHQGTWGNDGHGIPGANPSHAGRVGKIAAAVVLVVGIGTFVLLTRGPAPNKTATQYIADVAKEDVMQPQLDQALHTSPADSSNIVHGLAQTLVKEDRRLSTGHWPTRVNRDIDSLVATNQREVAILNKYASASSSERATLLKRENNDASSGAYYGRQIRAALGAGPASS
jgi:hypothetical protein